jgi:predicted ATP-grasp superfamily ATP-dependent carboligase
VKVPREPGDLYQLTQAGLDLESDLVMLYYLDGFIDAGAAGRQLASHLLTTFEHTEIARFDVDSLIDYRSRRPAMFFVKDHWETVEAPEIVVHLLRDAAGTPFLLLDGLEPDREWETFTRAVLKLSAALKVRLVASFHGIPMGAPPLHPNWSTATSRSSTASRFLAARWR